nr:unnamed protein product [Spirometra erinaceieuropaei]
MRNATDQYIPNHTMPISSLIHAPAVAADAAAAAVASAAPDASSGCRLPAAVCTTIMPTSVICNSIA